MRFPSAASRRARRLRRHGGLGEPWIALAQLAEIDVLERTVVDGARREELAFLVDVDSAPAALPMIVIREATNESCHIGSRAAGILGEQVTDRASRSVLVLVIDVCLVRRERVPN